MTHLKQEIVLVEVEDVELPAREEDVCGAKDLGGGEGGGGCEGEVVGGVVWSGRRCVGGG